jgi:hypothetical protein
MPSSGLPAREVALVAPYALGMPTDTLKSTLRWKNAVQQNQPPAVASSLLRRIWIPPKAPFLKGGCSGMLPDVAGCQFASIRSQIFAQIGPTRS